MNFMELWLFIFGAALGSFINVLGGRYVPERWVWSPAVMGGRSHCLRCGRMLRWFELFPLLSFFVQLGRCRRCKTWIGWRYLLVEILSGALCVLVPLRVLEFYGEISAGTAALGAVWTLFFLVLLLITLIDIRLYLIPNELTAFLGILAVGITGILGTYGFGGAFSSHTLSPGILSSVWLDHGLAMLCGGLIFTLIVFLTRGRGMGIGDVKLVLPLGMALGLFDMLLAIALSFVTGALFGICAMATGKKTLKSAVPFGPFLALGAALVFFWGEAIVKGYASLLGL